MFFYLCTQVCLLQSSVHMDAYLNATTQCTAVMFNQTALSTTFSWGDVATDANVDVNVQPRLEHAQLLIA